ncbi:MAG: Adenylate cyclase 2 [Deltaproteobacteria bacterium ADurb.Bin510]|nr:MAG: Adenylate cyclase 2 [Deltaproteobacteria bacterium ADurb.Bin510]
MKDLRFDQLKERLLSLEHGYEQKIAELSLLKELGQSLKTRNLTHWGELFGDQLDIIKRHTGIYSISLMLIDEDQRQLYVVSASNMGGSTHCTAIKLKPGEGIAGRVFETARTIYIPDVTSEPSFCNRGTCQVGALACVPIVTEGRCSGVLNFRDDQIDAFSPEDLRLFELIADQLSITVSLVRTYQEMLTLEKKRSNLSRYFSRGLAEHLLADERMSSLGGDLKPVTVVFCDINGFTPMVEKYPVDEVVAVLNRYFETVTPAIFARGGMLDKYLGDGVMAVFGIPDSRPEDALNAVRCACAIQNGIGELSKALCADGLWSITVGIGIASGMALAGNIGTPEQMNFTVIGEPVNLAQRLETICAPGETVICEKTRALLGDGLVEFDLDALGEVHVKGLQRAIQPWRANCCKKAILDCNLL